MRKNASLGGRVVVALCALLVGMAGLVTIGSAVSATPAAADHGDGPPRGPIPTEIADAFPAPDHIYVWGDVDIVEWTAPDGRSGLYSQIVYDWPWWERCLAGNTLAGIRQFHSWSLGWRDPGDVFPRPPGTFFFAAFLIGADAEPLPTHPHYRTMIWPEPPFLGGQTPEVVEQQFMHPDLGNASTWLAVIDVSGMTPAMLESCVGHDTDNTAPVANFTFAPAGTGPNDVAFTSTATDEEDLPEELTYFWDFEDGETSTERNPVHSFPGPGTYPVTLTVTDTDGATASRTHDVTIGGTVVNSTGDTPATDAAAFGCDTGGTIGDDAECTLRAALETATVDGGGEITFDIDTGGVPTITVGADPLPPVPGNTTIDGTSQDAGQVAIDGAGTETLLTLTGPGTTIEGLVLDNALAAILVEGGEGAVINENVIGADATGMTAGSVDEGVVVRSGNNVVVSENVIVAEIGVSAALAVVGAQFIDNAIGVQKGGGAVLGETRIGVLTVGPDAVVRGNTVHASLVGIGILSAQASGAEVRGNRIGVAGAANVVLDGNGQGVRVDGAPDVVVAENVIASARDEVSGDIGSVVVTGGQQVSEDPSGDGVVIVFFNRNGSEVADSPATATNVTITGNVIGDSAVTGSDDESGAKTGILAWDAPSNVAVHDNVIAGPERGVELYGGSGHSVHGNRIGIGTSDTPHPVESVGVLLDGATMSAVGADGQGNTIHTAFLGISFTGGSTEGSVAANKVTASGDEDTTCIAIGDDSDNVAVQDNTVVDCSQGVAILDAVGGSARRNVVQDPTVGLLIQGDATTAGTNIVLGATLQAFIVGAEDVTLEDNLIGTASRTGPIQPFDGGGISFLEGSGTVRNNVIVGADNAAIAVNTSDVVTLRGNRLEDIGQRPIVAPNGPDEPTIDAAIHSVAPDGSKRTTLLVTDLPDGEAGELEVFANDDCDPDGEAAKVLEVVKTKKVDRTTMIVQLIDRDDDNFTATYTDSSGTTSELSACAPIESYPDSDGDGSVDPIDDLTDGANDATRGVLITDDAQIVQVATDAGQLTGLAPIDDPAPGGHPGVDLPYGTLRFAVEGLAPGATANVTFLVVDGDAMQPDSTYWKFAPPSPGAAPSWFDFSFDENSGLGAQTLDPVDVDGLGFRRPLQVSLQDGGLGDVDGFPNGTIVDPGAIAVPNGDGPGDPGDPDPEGPGSGGDGPINSPGASDPVPTPDALAQPSGTASGATSDATPETLPRTGAPLLALMVLGAVFLFMGSAFRRTTLALRRRGRRRTAP